MSEPVLQRPSHPAAAGEEEEPRVRAGRTGAKSGRPGPRPASSLYDWAVEIPEWRAGRERRSRIPALADLPDLHAAGRGVPPGGGLAVSRARLTRRGRVVLVAVLTLAATSALSLLFLTAATAGDSASGAPTESSLFGVTTDTVVVEDGDTLWGIAEQERPSEDPRRTVHEIVELNDLPGSDVAPGQELLLPAS